MLPTERLEAAAQTGRAIVLNVLILVYTGEYTPGVLVHIVLIL
jgi:hypothetical protein